jgi:hypothetical protein
MNTRNKHFHGWMIKLTSTYYQIGTIFKIQILKIIDKLSTMARAMKG